MTYVTLEGSGTRIQCKAVHLFNGFFYKLSFSIANLFQILLRDRVLVRRRSNCVQHHDLVFGFESLIRKEAHNQWILLWYDTLWRSMPMSRCDGTMAIKIESWVRWEPNTLRNSPQLTYSISDLFGIKRLETHKIDEPCFGTQGRCQDQEVTAKCGCVRIELPFSLPLKGSAEKYSRNIKRWVSAFS